MIMNGIIKKEYSNVNYEVILNKELKQIIDQGFIFKDNICFLKYFSSRKINKEDFIDLTGYECFINHVYVDDYVEKDLLSYGLKFVEKMFEKYRTYKTKGHLIAILSLTFDDFSSLSIQFHQKRKNETYIDLNDIDSYQENGIMLLES